MSIKIKGWSKLVQIVPSTGYSLDVEIERYPDGTPFTKTWPKDGVNISTIEVVTTTVSELVDALFYVDALRARGHSVGNLYLPYVPGARQDRMNREGDYLFALKSVAALINAREFKKVTVVDPHSEVTPALINNSEVITVGDIFNDGVFKFRDAYDYVVAPDAGAVKRAALVGKFFSIPVLQGWKVRDISTGELTGFGIQDHDQGPEPTYLIVDDICDGGGTFMGLAAEIQNNHGNAVLDLYVTHGLFSKGSATGLHAAFTNVFTADTIVEERNRAVVQVIPINRNKIGN